MATPGLMCVASRPKTISHELYNRWYNEEHLPDVISHEIGKLGMRYQNTNPQAQTQFIALYPVEDVAIMASEKLITFIEDKKKSKILECQDTHELIEFDNRPYAKTGTHESKDGAKGRGQTLVWVAVETADEAVFEKWYRGDHLAKMERLGGYLRSTKCLRLDGVEPKFVALHEYAESPTLGGVNTGELPAGAKSIAIDVFQLIQQQGDLSMSL